MYMNWSLLPIKYLQQCQTKGFEISHRSKRSKSKFGDKDVFFRFCVRKSSRFDTSQLLKYLCLVNGLPKHSFSLSLSLIPCQKNSWKMETASRNRALRFPIKINKLIRSLQAQAQLIGYGVVVPAKKHRNAASKNVEPSLLLLHHQQTPLSQAGFPGSFPARSRRLRDVIRIRIRRIRHRKRKNVKKIFGGDLIIMEEGWEDELLRAFNKHSSDGLQEVSCYVYMG